MKMKRTHDDETQEVSYSIQGFDFAANITVTPQLPTNRMIQIEDKGGVVLVMQTSAGQAESLAMRKLWEFHKDNVFVN